MTYLLHSFKGRIQRHEDQACPLEGGRDANLPSAAFDRNRHGINAASVQHLGSHSPLQYGAFRMRSQVREMVGNLFHLRYGLKV